MLVSHLPNSPSGVDAAWLTEALGVAQPGTHVRGIERVDTIHGAGTKLQLRVDYEANPSGLPEMLWVKAGWEEHSALTGASGAYVREAVFFDSLQQPGVRAPCAFFSAWTAAGDGLIIMEDLHRRGAELWTCTAARSVADVAAMLETLATLHASWWNSPGLLALDWIDIPIRSSGPSSAWPRANGAERLREVLSGPRGEGLPSHVKDPQRIERTFWRMVEDLEAMPAGCLIHGDTHPGNCFSDADGGAGLYDWQSIARGPWAFDVAYHIVTSLTPEDRRRSERDLLRHYRAALARLGVNDVPSEAEAWDLYRRYIAYPLLIWPTNHISHQAEENIQTLTYRLGIAADDFGLFDLWSI